MTLNYCNAYILKRNLGIQPENIYLVEIGSISGR